jgi:hypothetical protein
MRPDDTAPGARPRTDAADGLARALRPVHRMRNLKLAAIASVLAFSLVATARGQPLDQIRVGDLAGSGGRWQSGEVTIGVPAREVQRWFADAPRWPARFPDVQWARVEGKSSDGRAIVRFRSRIIGRTLTLDLREQPGLITYVGNGKGVTLQGRMYFTPRGPGTTHVVLQTSADLHGLAGAFASAKTKRGRAFKKLRADLTALTRLERSYAAARRPGG